MLLWISLILLLTACQAKYFETKIEIIAEVGQTMTFQCHSYTNKTRKNATWSLSDLVLTNSSKYTIASSGLSLQIDDVQISDRNVYKCTEQTSVEEVLVTKCRLRVRDPKGALWPFVAIIGEMILLFVIIQLDGIVRTASCFKNKVGQKYNAE